MILTASELRQRIDGVTVTDDQIETRLNAIEAVIRAYTNNNFQNRSIRFYGRSVGMLVYGSPLYFAAGDTVQISASGVNDGLYTVAAVGEDYLQLDRFLHETENNLVTKIAYPPDVVQCAVDLFEWKQNMGDKVGIKSETLSRHSVTYEDSASLFMGYPVGILSGLQLHKKARC